MGWMLRSVVWGFGGFVFFLFFFFEKQSEKKLADDRDRDSFFLMIDS